MILSAQVSARERGSEVVEQQDILWALIRSEALPEPITTDDSLFKLLLRPDLSSGESVIDDIRFSFDASLLLGRRRGKLVHSEDLLWRGLRPYLKTLGLRVDTRVGRHIIFKNGKPVAPTDRVVIYKSDGNVDWRVLAQVLGIDFDRLRKEIEIIQSDNHLAEDLEIAQQLCHFYGFKPIILDLNVISSQVGLPSQEFLSSRSFTLWIDPGQASVDDVRELLDAVSELNMANGGPGLVFRRDGDQNPVLLALTP